jgi:hypothetical protein
LIATLRIEKINRLQASGLPRENAAISHGISLRYPTTGSVRCCARAATGQAIRQRRCDAKPGDDGVDADGNVVFRRQLKRRYMLLASTARYGCPINWLQTWKWALSR